MNQGFNYDFYGEIKKDYLPNDFGFFLNLISTNFNLPPDDVLSCCFELEQKDHKYYRITEQNYSEICKNKNGTIHIYFTEDELECNKQKNEIEDNKIPEIKIEKDQVIKNIVSKIKKLRALKAEKEKDKENIQITSLEEIINKKIKDLTAQLVKEANMGVSTIIENSRLERVKEFEKKKENKKICISVHNGIKCDGCNMNNIKGLRYKCTICDEFNYCEKCEEKFGEKHQHPFYKLRFEIE